MEKKRRILKQQIKLLTGKTTLARWTKVLSQALIHLNDADCPIIQTEALYQDTSIMKVQKSWNMTQIALFSLWTVGKYSLFYQKGRYEKQRNDPYLFQAHIIQIYIYIYTQLVNKVSKNGSLLPVLCSLPFLIKTVWQGNFMGFFTAYVQRTKRVGKTVLHSRACRYYS